MLGSVIFTVSTCCVGGILSPADGVTGTMLTGAAAVCVTSTAAMETNHNNNDILDTIKLRTNNLEG